MLEAKTSAIVISTQKELNAIPQTDWNCYGNPFKPLFYVKYRKQDRLFCSVIARDCSGKLVSLPWNFHGKDVKKGLKGRGLINCSKKEA